MTVDVNEGGERERGTWAFDVMPRHFLIVGDKGAENLCK